MASDTQNLIHKIRFANLGKSQGKIAEMLGITERYWCELRKDELRQDELEQIKIRLKRHELGQLQLREDELNELQLRKDKLGKERSSLSHITFIKFHVIALVHRPFPIEFISKSNKSSLCARSMESYLKKVTDLSEVHEVLGYLKEYLRIYPEDWGLLHLFGSTSFLIFKLDPQNRNRLNDAKINWRKSAEKVKSELPNNSLLRGFLEINALSAEIHEDYYLNNKTPQGNFFHYKKYRDFADEVTSKDYQVPAIWRDCLEQACLLKKEDLVKNNLERLLDLIDKMNIPTIDHEVVLKEIKGIDSFKEVEKLPLFQKWEEDLTQRESKKPKLVRKP